MMHRSSGTSESAEASHCVGKGISRTGNGNELLGIVHVGVSTNPLFGSARSHLFTHPCIRDRGMVNLKPFAGSKNMQV